MKYRGEAEMKGEDEGGQSVELVARCVADGGDDR